MNPKTLTATIAFALAGAAPSVSLAAGSAPAAWVSPKGTDSAGCGAATAPCRTFQYVHDNVIGAGGQIRVLEPGGFSPLVIRKSVSIINDGAGVAGATAPSGDAISIQAGATDSIFIKGLTLDGGGTGTNGIKALAAGSVTVANCVLRNFKGGAQPDGNGIFIAATTDVAVNIFDTIASENGYVGILVGPQGAATARASVSRVQLTGNQFGLDAYGLNTTGKVFTTIEDSFATNNTNTGMVAFAKPARNTSLVIKHSSASNNNFGVRALEFTEVIAFDASASLNKSRDLATDENSTFISGGNNLFPNRVVNGTKLGETPF